MRPCRLGRRDGEVVRRWARSTVSRLAEMILPILFGRALQEAAVAVLAIDWGGRHELIGRGGRPVRSGGAQATLSARARPCCGGAKGAVPDTNSIAATTVDLTKTALADVLMVRRFKRMTACVDENFVLLAIPAWDGARLLRPGRWWGARACTGVRRCQGVTLFRDERAKAQRSSAWDLA